MRGLAPTLIRIGGTAADAALYLPADPRRKIGSSTTVVSDATWDSILSFASASGASLLWNLNSKSFRSATSWDPTRNATAFLAYTAAKHPGVDVAWSVGNEPSSSVSATLLVQETAALAALLPAYGVGAAQYGPSFSTTDDARAAAFMEGTRGGGLTGFTTHRYPLGSNCAVADHVGRAASDALGQHLSKLVALKVAHADPGLLMVLEETAGG